MGRKNPRKIGPPDLPPRTEVPLGTWLARIAQLFIGAVSNPATVGFLELGGAAGAAATAGNVAILGPFAATFAGLANLAYANDLAANLAQRNAFRVGFARELDALAHGRDWVGPYNPLYRSFNIRGRNAAIRMLRQMGEARSEFLERYNRNDGFEIALEDLGGLEVH